MINMFKSIIKTLLITIVILGVSQMVYGQPPSGPPPGGAVPSGNTPPCWAPECIPIDGGLGMLLAAGAMLGFKSLKGKK